MCDGAWLFVVSLPTGCLPVERSVPLRRSIGLQGSVSKLQSAPWHAVP